jgi:quercetin dioxygenase-like cupin family protein
MNEKMAEVTSERETHALTGESLCFNLQQEVQQLREEEQWKASGRNAKTLVKYSDLRIVLTALRKGEKLQTHKAEGRISIQILNGRLKLHLPDHEVQMVEGNLMTLDHAVPHDVEALEDSSFLITIAWNK